MFENWCAREFRNSELERSLDLICSGAFPDKHATESEKDFIRSFELAGGDGVSEEFLANVFAHKKFTNVELIKGDICETVPAYIQNHSALKSPFFILMSTCKNPPK